MSRTDLTRLSASGNAALEVYLLPRTRWQDAFSLQQRLVYELGELPRSRAALILCEHPPILTVGRQGSRRHIRLDDDFLKANRIDVQWTNRGGGCWFQAPGQLAVYPIVPINPQRMGLERYRSALYRTVLDVLEEFGIPAERDVDATGVRVGDREIASVGIAVKDWVAYHGCTLNVCPNLDQFDEVQFNPKIDRPMTSMFRESRTPIRIEAVRESFIRAFVQTLGFHNYYLCDAGLFESHRNRDTLNVAIGNH